MTIFQAVIFGLVQGVTEFLPVSSTAHLILLPWFLGWPDPGLSFDVALHLGTLVALVIYFWKDWLALLSKPRMIAFIIAATIPGAVAGVLFESQVENALRSPKIVALMLSLMALVLVVAELKGRRKKDLDQISWRDAMTVGFAQAFAIVPGVSRSGFDHHGRAFHGSEARNRSAILLLFVDSHYCRRGRQKDARYLQGGFPLGSGSGVCYRDRGFGNCRLPIDHFPAWLS